MNKYFAVGLIAGFSSLFGLFLSSPATASDYNVQKSGVVTDNTTELSWLRNDDNIKRQWNDAKKYCKGLSFAGYDDWRLPSQYELKTIRVVGSTYPALDQKAFPTTKADKYWTETELPYYEDKAFFVDFGEDTTATDFNESLEAMKWENKYYSRCVRGTHKKVSKK
ncbi:MAG: DUF1566 domain-containing protein [Proteobacteria bacterium]|nr:DUF1566 domain-containing protein [Pseudomonadota bacterium]MBU1685751.1 DUF1566 domain-containing protein [Pseudomonadota bacterium]